MEVTYKRHKIFFLSIALITFISISISQFAFADKREKGVEGAYNYLSSQIKGIGLIDSYGDDFSRTYTYDNALAVFAFVVYKDYARAKKILSAYKNKIGLPNYGGYNDEYDYISGQGKGLISTGPNGWLLNAINFYYCKTSDPQFLTLAQKLADFLVGLQDKDGGLFGDAHVSWKSTEHNIIGYTALYNYGVLTKRDLYVRKANLIKDFILKECWNGERFLRGKGDATEITNIQAHGVLSMGTAYASAIQWAESHTKCTKPLGNLSVTGFDFNNDLDAVWFEGTLQQAMAFKKNYDTSRAIIYYNDVDKTQRGNGSFLCATNQGTTGFDWRLQPLESVAPTCWYIFYNTNTNPFIRWKR